MPPNQLPRKPLSQLSSSPFLPPLARPRPPPRRFQSSRPDARTRTRAARILDRVPRSLRTYTDGLRTAPVSHVVSFLVLHELTAIVPLVGLAAAFHTWGLPDGVRPRLLPSNIPPPQKKFFLEMRRERRFEVTAELMRDKML
jgi:hypothetical protein